MRSCATQKNCCMTFWGGWKNSLFFLNNLSVDHNSDAWHEREKNTKALHPIDCFLQPVTEL